MQFAKACVTVNLAYSLTFCYIVTTIVALFYIALHCWQCKVMY